MKTPGLGTIRNFFSGCFSAAHSAASLNGVLLRIIGAAILVAAVIPPATAAPQSNSNYPLNREVPSVGSLPSPSQSNDAFTPDTLLGTLSATPSSVSFSSVPLGLTNSQSLSLKNTGSANVKISSTSLVGGRFRLTGLSNSTVISPGQSVTFNISFKPVSAGTSTATASIHSNASNSPLNISISGTGTAGTTLLSATPSSLSFGNVTVGASSTLNVSLKNSGNMSVTINKLTVPNSVFTTNGVSVGTILAPAQTATLSVTYSPISISNAGGNISIFTSGSSNSTNISVAGAGVQNAPQSVSLNWQASTSNGVIGYYVYRGTVSGGPYNALNSSTDANTQYTDSTVQPSTTYYYVVTSVDSSNMQSGYSSQVVAAIPAK